MNQLTAAHQSLPFGTVVRVTNLDNGRKVDVRINDRGPFVKRRIIDLSREAARRVDMVRAGTAPVRVTILSWPDPAPEPPAVAVRRAEGEPVACVNRSHFGVQVGSFALMENAERMRGKMAALYEAARIYAAQAGARILYRVVVGAAESEAQAALLRDKIAAGRHPAFVRQVDAVEAAACL